MPKRRRRYRSYHYSGIELFLALAVLCAAGGAYLSRFSSTIFYSFFIGALVLSIFMCVVLAWMWYQHRRRMFALGLSGVDQMGGIAFEQYLQWLLKTRGYHNVIVTKAEGDFGADLICEKDSHKYAVQAKRYTQDVGVEAIYQVMGGEKYYGCDQTMVITNSHFTHQAKELAKKTHTLLVDREQLSSWIAEANVK